MKSVVSLAVLAALAQAAPQVQRRQYYDFGSDDYNDVPGVTDTTAPAAETTPADSTSVVLESVASTVVTSGALPTGVDGTTSVDGSASSTYQLSSDVTTAISSAVSSATSEAEYLTLAEFTSGEASGTSTLENTSTYETVSTVAPDQITTGFSATHTPISGYFTAQNATVTGYAHHTGTGPLTTLTVYTTEVTTVTACPPSVTNCPNRVVTKTIALTTTVCPVSKVPEISSSVIQEAESGHITGVTVTSIPTATDDDVLAAEATTTTLATLTSTHYVTLDYPDTKTRVVDTGNNYSSNDDDTTDNSTTDDSSSNNGNGDSCVPVTVTVTEAASTVYVTVGSNNTPASTAQSENPSNEDDEDYDDEEDECDESAVTLTATVTSTRASSTFASVTTIGDESVDTTVVSTGSSTSVASVPTTDSTAISTALPESASTTSIVAEATSASEVESSSPVTEAAYTSAAVTTAPVVQTTAPSEYDDVTTTDSDIVNPGQSYTAETEEPTGYEVY